MKQIVIQAVMTGALLPLPAVSAAKELRAGAARVDITPPMGFAMWGYAVRKDQPSLGVRDPLRAVLSCSAPATNASRSSASISAERQPAPRWRRSGACSASRDRARLSRRLAHASWSRPRAGQLAVGEGIRRSAQLEQKLGDVILEAAKALKPARVGVASKQVALNRNRHSKRAEKPVDRELLVLRVEDAEGKVIAHAVNFAAHATMRDSKERKFSADYPGVLADLVEKETAAPCLFLQGAAGDLSANPSGEGGADAFGRELGRQVLALARGIRCAAIEPVLQTREEDFLFKPRINVSNPIVRLCAESGVFPGDNLILRARISRRRAAASDGGAAR